jgi:hypothetical protein
MIIVCSGPDTYRAREKARELVAAFRAKHDSGGLAMETVDGAEGVSVLLSRLASGSLFSRKKLIRADGCLTKMKIADVRTLAARLEADKDATIILTVEEEAPNAKTLEALKMAPLFHYPCPAQVGSAFRTWAQNEAVKRGVSQKTADALARTFEGDSWRVINELEKQSAHAIDTTPEGLEKELSIFDVADRVLTQRQNWRSDFSSADEGGTISVALGQSRSYLSIRDGHAQGVHPYVAKKLGSLRIAEPEKRSIKLLRAFIASRNSLAPGNEPQTLV